MREQVPVELGDGASATVDIERTEGQGIVIHSVTITAPPGRSVTTEHLRTMSLLEAAGVFRDMEKDPWDDVPIALLMEDVEPLPTKGRWSNLTEDEYADYAEDYLRTVASNPRKPVQEMAERRGVDISVVRDRLKACRKFGWLWGTSQGRVGSIPGPRLREYRLRKGVK